VKYPPCDGINDDPGQCCCCDWWDNFCNKHSYHKLVEYQGHGYLQLRRKGGSELWFRNEKGLTTMELFLMLPFLLLLVGIIFTIGGRTTIENTVAAAAREAARHSARHYQFGPNTEAWQKAVNTMQGTHIANWSLGPGNSTTPHKAFDPLNPNPTVPDVIVENSSGYSCATVTFHMPTPLPGMAKLIDPSASLMTPYMDITQKAYFKCE